MTFAEIILSIVVLVVFYLLMKPLQRYLEARFLKFFHSGSPGKNKPVIDITDYQKKDKPKS